MKLVLTETPKTGFLAMRPICDTYFLSFLFLGTAISTRSTGGAESGMLSGSARSE